MCTTRLFSQGNRPLCTRSLLDRVIPINHSWHQKTRNTGLRDADDCISLRSLVLTQQSPRSPNSSLKYRQLQGRSLTPWGASPLGLYCVHFGMHIHSNPGTVIRRWKSNAALKLSNSQRIYTVLFVYCCAVPGGLQVYRNSIYLSIFF